LFKVAGVILASGSILLDLSNDSLAFRKSESSRFRGKRAVRYFSAPNIYLGEVDGGGVRRLVAVAEGGFSGRGGVRDGLNRP